MRANWADQGHMTDNSQNKIPNLYLFFSLYSSASKKHKIAKGIE